MKIRKIVKLRKTAFRKFPNKGVWAVNAKKRTSFLSGRGVPDALASALADTSYLTKDVCEAYRLSGNNGDEIYKYLRAWEEYSNK